MVDEIAMDGIARRTANDDQNCGAAPASAMSIADCGPPTAKQELLLAAILYPSCAHNCVLQPAIADKNCN